MVVKKIAYSKTYPIANLGAWEKIFMEAEIIQGDDLRKCLYDLKSQVENFHYESNKAAEKQAEVLKSEPPTLTKIADLIKEINFCKDVETLERVYKYVAKSDTDVQAAYDKKFRELLKLTKHE